VTPYTLARKGAPQRSLSRFQILPWSAGLTRIKPQEPENAAQQVMEWYTHIMELAVTLDPLEPSFGTLSALVEKHPIAHHSAQGKEACTE
jgi:hypothetical protein